MSTQKPKTATIEQVLDMIVQQRAAQDRVAYGDIVAPVVHEAWEWIDAMWHDIEASPDPYVSRTVKRAIEKQYADVFAVGAGADVADADLSALLELRDTLRAMPPFVGQGVTLLSRSLVAATVVEVPNIITRTACIVQCDTSTRIGRTRDYRFTRDPKGVRYVLRQKESPLGSWKVFNEGAEDDAYAIGWKVAFNIRTKNRDDVEVEHA